MMESIGKLRELCAKWRKTSITPGRNSAADEVDAIADEIEREIEDKRKEHSRTIEYRCKKAETDCEIYRKKFGKCIDYADAIHALMDDEGIA